MSVIRLAMGKLASQKRGCKSVCLSACKQVRYKKSKNLYNEGRLKAVSQRDQFGNLIRTDFVKEADESVVKFSLFYKTMQ